jgi:signal transduction histidine kinase/phage shock protein PspC (stress-responsive transcriptional regulator)
VSTPPYTPRRLKRAVDGRLLGGVAAGLADHLRLPVLLVRAGFVLLTAFGGAGLMLYGALWFLTPQDLQSSSPPARRVDRRQLTALAVISAGVLALAGQTGLGGRYLWPAVAGAVGLGLVWQQADTAQRSRWRAVATGSSSRWAAVLRLVVGAVLIGLGMVGFLASQGQFAKARAGLLSTGVVVAGLVLLAGPWVARLARDLGAERRERIRAQEREEIAAQVHDSVLHTLALIRRNSADPKAVARLARSQERSLRTWLQRPSGQPGETLGSALERVAGEVEEEHGITVEVVAVGDAPLDDALRSLVQAAREAIVNAAKSSGADVVSVYVEVEAACVTVFVRDRGRGFDLAAIPADRHGISGSIVGRMRRGGGSATVRTAPGEGTEVELSVRRVRA